MLACLVVVGTLIGVLQAEGFGGEASKESKTDYLSTEVSLFLGAENYRELFMAKNKGSDDFQDRILDMVSKSFEAADIDQNGSLSRQELAIRLGTNKNLLTNVEKLEEFHGMDSNGDNALSWREFMMGSFSKDFVDSFDRGHVDIEGLNVEGGRAEYEAFHAYHKYGRFKLADFDKSDSLNTEEFLRFVNPSLHPELRESFYNEVITDVQHDEDNEHVSMAEFKSNVEMKALLSKPEDAGRYMAEQLEKFHVLDVDRDGKLNTNETKQWLFGDVNTNSTHLVKSEVETHFRVCDTNGDGLLQFEEMLEQPVFLFEGIDPDANEDLSNQLRRLMDEQNKTDITDFFTEEAISDLAEKEQEKRRILGELADNYDLSDDELGFDNGFGESSVYDYDPAWDPDNKVYKHGFIAPTQTSIPPGYSAAEYAEQMKERNGYNNQGGFPEYPDHEEVPQSGGEWVESSGTKEGEETAEIPPFPGHTEL